MLNWMMTGNYLIVHYGENRPCILERGSEKFEKIFPLITKGGAEQEVINILDITSKIQEYTQGTFEVDKDSGQVTSNGKSFDSYNVISERILQFQQQGLPFEPLEKFWENIQENPSEESREHLYLFLEANKMPITDDGCFLAYKRVTRDSKGNLVDTRTQKYNNNIGKIVEMPRDKVDPRRDVTCSYGLHVAAYNYANKEYYGSDLLEVKVNPRDVVAVPIDYNNQKMRVCRYEVIGINKGTNPEKNNFIPKTDERVKRKLAEKVDKNKKINIKQEARQQLLDERKNRINTQKAKKPGEIVSLLYLTAYEIIDVVKHLTGELIFIDLKNKKAIIKKALKILKEKGFYYKK